jgi:hypothetical protein
VCEHRTVPRARVRPAGWSAGVDDLQDRIAGRSGRIECWRRVCEFLVALLADLPRKNCWTLAEHADPGLLALWDPGPLGVDNRVHHVLDVTQSEDRSDIRVGSKPHVLPILPITAERPYKRERASYRTLKSSTGQKSTNRG